MAFSCGTPLWCYFNTFMWHALWSTQVQLAAEKESSKSLLSMVCDATFWVSRQGGLRFDWFGFTPTTWIVQCCMVPISGYLDMRKPLPGTFQDFNFDILKNRHFLLKHVEMLTCKLYIYTASHQASKPASPQLRSDILQGCC